MWYIVDIEVYAAGCRTLRPSQRDAPQYLQTPYPAGKAVSESAENIRRVSRVRLALTPSDEDVGTYLRAPLCVAVTTLACHSEWRERRSRVPRPHRWPLHAEPSKSWRWKPQNARACT